MDEAWCVTSRTLRTDGRVQGRRSRQRLTSEFIAICASGRSVRPGAFSYPGVAYLLFLDPRVTGVAAPEFAVARTFGFSCLGFFTSLLPRLLSPFPIISSQVEIPRPRYAGRAVPQENQGCLTGGQGGDLGECAPRRHRPRTRVKHRNAGVVAQAGVCGAEGRFGVCRGCQNSVKTGEVLDGGFGRCKVLSFGGLGGLVRKDRFCPRNTTQSRPNLNAWIVWLRQLDLGR